MYTTCTLSVGITQFWRDISQSEKVQDLALGVKVDRLICRDLNDPRAELVPSGVNSTCPSLFTLSCLLALLCLCLSFLSAPSATQWGGHISVHIAHPYA